MPIICSFADTNLKRMLSKIPRQFYYFLAAIFILNLIQSFFTELIFDEAYYWYYSQHMAWGYFDHPPLVALLIKISRFFFTDELGVRFMSCVISTLNIVVLWLLIDAPKKNQYIPHFFVLVFSMPLLNAYGFLTLPDTPLLFFTACFLLTYKHFIKKPTLGIAVVMGVFMAALMYSKYHAVLVIVFVLASNLRLVTNKYAWLSVLVALACYVPHFYWLFENDFVSINYHIYERPNGAYSFEKNTLGFLVNLVAVFGLTFPFVYLSLYKTKNTDLFQKALLYLVYGVIIFFFVSSFNRRVQTQWIIIICIPMLLLVFNYMLKDASTLRWIFRLGIINTIVILYLRLGLVYQPLLLNFYYETHGNKDWAKAIQKEVGNLPVVFENSYRNAPMYSFYADGTPTFSLNNVMYRKNQYSIDDSEEFFRGKDVAYISRYLHDPSFTITTANGGVHKGKFIKDFEPYRKITCTVSEEDAPFTVGKEISLRIYNPYPKDIALQKLRFGIAFLNKYKIPVETIPIAPKLKNAKHKHLVAKDSTAFSFTLPTPSKENTHYFRVVISENNLLYGLNGKPILIH